MDRAGGFVSLFTLDIFLVNFELPAFCHVTGGDFVERWLKKKKADDIVMLQQSASSSDILHHRPQIIDQ